MEPRLGFVDKKESPRQARSPEAQIDAICGELQVVGVCRGRKHKWERATHDMLEEFSEGAICAALQFSNHWPHVATLN